MLDIFFEALNYETIEQKKAYEVAALLGKSECLPHKCPHLTGGEGGAWRSGSRQAGGDMRAPGGVWPLRSLTVPTILALLLSQNGKNSNVVQALGQFMLQSLPQFPYPHMEVGGLKGFRGLFRVALLEPMVFCPRGAVRALGPWQEHEPPGPGKAELWLVPSRAPSWRATLLH